MSLAPDTSHEFIPRHIGPGAADQATMLAAIGATAIGYAVATMVFQFPYHVNHWIWLAGPVAGLLCVSLNAWAGARAALNHPPLLALREA